MLPPCIEKAVEAKDVDAFEEILSYIKSYATDEETNAILWSIGYYNLENYNRKKATLQVQLMATPHFPCTPFEKPRHLSQYCTPKDERACPLRDGREKLNRLVKEVSLKFYEDRPLLRFTVKLKDGATFTADKVHYTSSADEDLWLSLAGRFIEWYSNTHHGYEFPDAIPLPTEAVAKFFIEKIIGGVAGGNNSSALRALDDV